ncbi:hypothetical protein ACLOJK_015002, partial [Asimina triloba]
MRAPNCLPIAAGKDACCDESFVRDWECMPVACPCDNAGGARDVEIGTWRRKICHRMLIVVLLAGQRGSNRLVGSRCSRSGSGMAHCC